MPIQMYKHKNSLDFDGDPIETEWQNKLSELKEFDKKHGHTRPFRDSEEFKCLRMWCVDQRQNYSKGELSQGRIDLLNSLNFDWDLIETEWQNKFSQLRQFKKKYSHASPSRTSKEFSSLGIWCSNQRWVYKKGKLSQWRIDLLNSLNFDWDPKETEWQNKFSELKEFKKKHGHTSPSRKRIEFQSLGYWWKQQRIEFQSLGYWCKQQRVNYRKGKLPSEKFNLLDSIGFKWD